MCVVLTLSPGKAIWGLDVMVIFARACPALILPMSVFSDARGIKACVRGRKTYIMQNL